MPATDRAAPRARYAADLARPGFKPDPAQAAAVDALQGVYDALVASPPRLLRQRWKPVPGLYLWGGVGRGKTYLMDRFFAGLPFSRKRRAHFHRFMQWVHARRKAYAQRRDPLILIARELARDRVLCFDEFFVADVADAMILGRLVGALFEQGVTLVATSNTPPQALYAGGLQREHFLPAIAGIERHCRVLQLDGATDYRLRALERAQIYHHPADASAEAHLARYFHAAAGADDEAAGPLEVNGRAIPVRAAAADVAWFDFAALCEGPRSADDYSEIARCHHTVLLSSLPVLTGDDDNAARRFIALVDEFYDRRVKLIASAAAAPDALYQGRRLAFEFQRTASRLHEMATRAYLAEAHRP